MLANPREALDLLLQDRQLTPAELDDLVTRFPEESQYHEYKDGVLTSDRKKAAETIRQYVSGFANADGGTLIIGVAEQRPRPVSPCQPRGSEPLDKWVEGHLLDMVPFFSPPPRIQLVQHPKGPVIVIAVARAPVLVPCIESRKQRYYMRFNQSTSEVPEFLLADLVLGRRRQPVVEIQAAYNPLPPYVEDRTCSLELFFKAENLGFASAEEIGLGFVTWNARSSPEKLNSHLLSHVDLGEKPSIGDLEWSLHHGTYQPKPAGITSLPFIERHVEILAGVYFLARESLPQWFQLRIECGRESGEVSRTSTPIITALEATRLFGQRPRIQCKQL